MKAAWKLFKDTIPEAQTICTAFTKDFRKTKKNPDCLNYLSNSRKEATKSRTASFEKLKHSNKKKKKPGKILYTGRLDTKIQEAKLKKRRNWKQHKSEN